MTSGIVPPPQTFVVLGKYSHSRKDSHCITGQASHRTPFSGYNILFVNIPLAVITYIKPHLNTGFTPVLHPAQMLLNFKYAIY